MKYDYLIAGHSYKVVQEFIDYDQYVHRVGEEWTFFDLLFGLNNELVPDMKWRYYCAEQLDRLPHNFADQITGAMTLHSFTLEELERRKPVFMKMWPDLKLVVAREVQMTFDEMLQIV